MVQGSDQADSANIERLRDKGVKIFIGHDAGQSTAPQVVVISSAVKADNPEMVAARAQRLPVVRRAEMLAELMRLKSCVAIGGTHGKTTTTSMVGALLDAGGLDPTVINGGIINAYGTNARLGAGDWMVVEADESDGTFLKLPATSPSSPTSIPSTSTTTGPSTPCRRRSETSSRTCRSTASP